MSHGKNIVHGESGTTIVMPTTSRSKIYMLTNTTPRTLSLRRIESGNRNAKCFRFFGNPFCTVLQHIVVVVHPLVFGPGCETTQLN